MSKSATDTLFITGFPGFIAERLVCRLADPPRRFFLLVQPEFIDRAKDAVKRISETRKVSPDNFSLVVGDITLPDLDISPEDAAAIVSETRYVFHLAAVYDLSIDRETAMRVNLEGTRNVNGFIERSSDLKRYNYISTCYVAGMREGNILETELVHDSDFRNFYEESKYLAEIEVEKLKERHPVTIFRPSVVVGDSKTGETAKYDGIYYLIQYLSKAPGLLSLLNVGSEDVRLNLVPVDFVVNAIAELGFDGRATGKTLALTDPEPLSTEELFDLFAEKLSGRRSAMAPPPALIEKFLMLPFAPPVTGLPHSGVPYFFLSQNYDSRVARGLMEKYGIACPNLRDYADNLLAFMRKHPHL